MDTNYLSSQVSTIIGQLHSLFDEIGVPIHEREARESEVGDSRLIDVKLMLTYCSCLLRSLRLYTIKYG
jgi:hypothetical protein